MGSKTKNFCKVIVDSSYATKDIMEKFKLFKDDMYEYMVYFVRKVFKVGFRYSAEFIIRDIEYENNN